MDRRRMVIISGAALLAIVALVLWLVLRGSPTTPPPAGVTPTTTPEDTSNLPPPVSTPTTPEPDRTGAVVAARVWAERFASWSNEDGFTNLQLLASQSTPAVQAFLQTYRSQMQQRYPLEQGYHGVTGRALSPVVDSLGGDSAQVSVAMQLAESTSTVPTVYNRTLELRLVRSGEGWLADFVKWVE